MNEPFPRESVRCFSGAFAFMGLYPVKPGIDLIKSMVQDIIGIIFHYNASLYESQK
jgi:hypothetical protein